MKNFFYSFALVASLTTIMACCDCGSCGDPCILPPPMPNNAPLVVPPPPPPPPPPTKLVYSYRRPDATNFFMTSDVQEATSIGTGLGPQRHGFIFLGTQFRVAESALDANWIPLYRYYNGNHFYTADPNEIGATQAVGSVGKYGYRYEGIIGYISKVPLPKTVALHRFYFPNNGNSHQYVTEDNPDYWMNRSNGGIVYENITGYVFTNRAFDP